ncbi:winged helix-turn-helix transcriptional regulator [Streptomyces sp. NPDC054796]
MPRRTHRSYDQFCAIARALDLAGDRWTLLIVRELLAGPRRYTDLHTDLPGVSTDMLATRLKDMERDGLAERRKLSRPGAAHVYELTDKGRGLLPVLTALAAFGAPELAERHDTDALRAHWFALPLLRALERAAGASGVAGAAGAHTVGTVDVQLDEGAFHLRLGAGGDAGAGAVYGEGPAEPAADVRIELDVDACVGLAEGSLTVEAGAKDGTVRVCGEGALARALRGEA